MLFLEGLEGLDRQRFRLKTGCDSRMPVFEVERAMWQMALAGATFPGTTRRYLIPGSVTMK